MTYETAIGMFETAQTGDELLQILDTLAADVAGFDYIESPQIAQILGIPTLEPMEF
jgi:hypothetical protein